MKKINLFIFAAIIFLSGCRSLPVKTEVGEPIKQKYDITVTVVPFTEKRLDVNRYGSAYKYLIPLVPYGTIRYERPEDAKMFNCPEEARTFNAPGEVKVNMTEHLATAAFNELERQKIFDKTVYAADPQKVDTDFILTADINSTLYEGKTYSYGISFLGPVLWSFGLPAGSSYNKLNLTFYLKRRDTGEVVWTYVLNKEKSIVQGLYYHRSENVNNYPVLLLEEMGGLIKDLKKRLSKMSAQELRIPAPVPVPVVLPAPEPVALLPVQSTTPPEPQTKAESQTQVEPVKDAPIAVAPAAENKSTNENPEKLAQ